jgi:adenosylcobinamide-GDP ribazoletransferase
MRGLLLAVSVLTRLPVRARTVDRATAGAAMGWAPLVGAALGALAAAVAVGARWCLGGDASLLAAAVLTLATGALHLDGLADTADALGVRGNATAVQAAAKQSTVGAYGVTAIALSLLVDVSAVAESVARGHAWMALIVGAAAGRLAATWACHGRPAARPDGLGAWVAQTVTTRRATTATVATTVVALAVGAADAERHVIAGVVAAGAVAVALLAGALVAHVGSRRFGGLTGDVLGATISCASTAAFLFVVLVGSRLR